MPYVPRRRVCSIPWPCDLSKMDQNTPNSWAARCHPCPQHTRTCPASRVRLPVHGSRHPHVASVWTPPPLAQSSPHDVTASTPYLTVYSGRPGAARAAVLIAQPTRVLALAPPRAWTISTLNVMARGAATHFGTTLPTTLRRTQQLPVH